MHCAATNSYSIVLKYFLQKRARRVRRKRRRKVRRARRRNTTVIVQRAVVAVATAVSQELASRFISGNGAFLR